jgi:iron complex outermembrane receptor protein
MKKNNVNRFFCLLLPFFSLGQEYLPCKKDMVLIVRDEHLQSPLKNSSIRHKNQVYSTQNKGQALVPNLCLGDSLFISHLGCESKFEIIKRLPDTLFFFLEHHPIEMNTTEILFKKQNFQQRSDMMPSKDPNAIGKSFAQILEQSSGTSILKTGANIEKPMLLGLTGNRVAFVQNGIRMETQSWGNEHAWEIDPFSKEKFEILLGANSIWYGTDGLGGVISSTANLPQKSSKPWWYFQGQSQGRGGSAGFFVPFSTRFTLFSIQGNYKKMGDFSTPSYVLRNTGIQEFSTAISMAKTLKNKATLSLNFQLFNSEMGILSWSHIGNLSDLQRMIDSNSIPKDEVFSYFIDRPRQMAQHQWFFAQYSTNRWKTTISRQYNYRTEYDKHSAFGVLGNLPQNEFGLGVNSFSLERIKKKSKELGWRGDVRNINQDYGGKYFVPQYRANIFGLSADRVFPGNRWRNHLVIRSEFHQYRSISSNSGPKTDRNGFGIGFGWNMKNETWRNTHFIFSSGRNWRFPGMNELFSNGLHHGTASIELGDATLKPEVAYFTEILVKKKFSNWELGSFSHLKAGFNFINLEPTGNYSLSVRGAFPVFNYTASNVVSWVQELSVQKTNQWLPNWQAQLKTSVVRLKKWGDESNLFGVPPVHLQANISHSLKKELIEWKPFFSAQYSSFPFWAPRNLEIGLLPEGYCLLDLGATFSWKDCSGSFQINNALNQNYFNYLDRLRYFASAPGRNFSIQLKKQIQ